MFYKVPYLQLKHLYRNKTNAFQQQNIQKVWRKSFVYLVLILTHTIHG